MTEAEIAELHPQIPDWALVDDFAQALDLAETVGGLPRRKDTALRS
ncbi:MAG TPA: hypothetical protein VNJ46_03115 [Gaiellaceae bacterium]|nr:hypothetical protein [Gaiellaceae bacterium]